MGKLIYTAITSADGYVADVNGRFDWAAPDEEVHAFVNEIERPVGTYLYGRRMYEVMQVWETDELLAAQSPATIDFASLWRAADKVVYSMTLPAVATTRTRIERDFDTDAVRQLKASSARDIAVGGPTLAARAIAAGLVDEYHWFIVPIVVGGGTRFLPNGVRVPLGLVDEHRFADGTIHLHYRNEVREPRPASVTTVARAAWSSRSSMRRFV